jgi:hypothetical protein
MHARGKTFEPSDKTLIPPISLAYKKRVFSPARIKYPMKRVDFDPNGERNPQIGVRASTSASVGRKHSTSSQARCYA